MPRRRRNRNRDRVSSNLNRPSGEDSSSLAGQQRDNFDISLAYVAILALLTFYWAYVHLAIALKCVKKLNNLLFQFWGYDRLNIPHNSILYLFHYWKFSLFSIPLILLFILVVMKLTPANYIVFGDVMFMCIFWLLDQAGYVQPYS